MTTLCETSRELDRLYLAADAATWRWIACAEEDWWRRYERAVEAARRRESA